MQTIDLLKNSSYEEKMDLLIAAVIKGNNTDYEALENLPQINGNLLIKLRTHTCDFSHE